MMSRILKPCCMVYLSTCLCGLLLVFDPCTGVPSARLKREAGNVSSTSPSPTLTTSTSADSLSPADTGDADYYDADYQDGLALQDMLGDIYDDSNDTVTLPTSMPTVTIDNNQQVGDTTLRPYDERLCFHPLVCMHGFCNKTVVGEEECVCDEGWKGRLCSDHCTLICGVNGDCRVDGVDEHQYCACTYPWQGPACDELPPEDPPPPDQSWVYWLGGGLGVGLLLLVTGGVLMMVCLWKKRFIVVMKIVHYFQPYEDEDGKLFDAFVSYRSCTEDMKFVYEALRHKLEDEMNFHLCLHERDFIPGEPIANNILWATENSRRTILVLSPRYLESDWARMEYQQAQYELLQRKQRIIPIMLEDISDFQDKMDPNLACILRTVTYLEHPGNDAEDRHMEKFWKRLELSMPKKKCTTSPDASAAAVSTIGTADVVLEDPPLNDLTKFRGQIPAETPPPAPTPTTTTTTVPIHRGEANKGVSGKPDRGLDRFVFGKFNTGTPDVCLLAVRPIDDKSLFQQKDLRRG